VGPECNTAETPDLECYLPPLIRSEQSSIAQRRSRRSKTKAYPNSSNFHRPLQRLTMEPGLRLSNRARSGKEEIFFLLACKAVRTLYRYPVGKPHKKSDRKIRGLQHPWPLAGVQTQRPNPGGRSERAGGAQPMRRFMEVTKNRSMKVCAVECSDCPCDAR
jgi:hypothetical protein